MTEITLTGTPGLDIEGKYDLAVKQHGEPVQVKIGWLQADLFPEMPRNLRRLFFCFSETPVTIILIYEL